ncbi:MAG: phosphatidylglycerol lysyltransferase domain-containing protein [Elusimicrobiota bacterium]|jgi:phosphatidylglycerol lysyltransferase|nr:phosphatidylglycerol lysyltransferase domain-containing protein [Elusimicrobiota bacterium]
MKKWLKILLILAGLLIFVAALYLLNSQLKSINPKDVLLALSDISNIKIAAAMLCALGYYMLLGGYDIIAFHHINKNVRLKPREIFFACFVSNALGNNTGYSMLFGGSLRYRLYSVYNVSIVDITKVIFFSSATIWLGLFAAGGLIFILDPVSLAETTGYNITTRTAGVLFLSILSVYIVLCSLNLQSIKFGKKQFSFPNIQTAAIQIALATADWVIASLTLYILMPSGIVSYFVLLKVFLVAQLLGILSQVPGGIGVFETSIAVLLPQIISNPSVIGGLLAYRAIFYFFPLSIALFTLAVYEIARLIKKVDEKTKYFGKAVSSVLVQILTISTFFGAIIAIFTTSTPFNILDLKKIVSLIPLGMLNLSHFLLSITAVGLLFTSRALQLRIENARKWALIFISCAIVFSIVMGGNLIILAYFICLFAAIFAAKKYFYRKRSMLNIPFNTMWFCAVIGIFTAAVWIGFIANKQDILLWIKHPAIFIEALFGDEESSRFLRTVIGISVLFALIAVEQIFRKAFNKTVYFTADDAKLLIQNTNYVYAFNALMGNKKLFSNEAKDTFLMYQNIGANRIALGDPIGVSENKRELIWQFKESGDRDNMRVSFVGVGNKYINAYRDTGLDIVSIASEAKIVLKDFKSNGYFQSLSETISAEGFLYEIKKSDEFYKYEASFESIDKLWEKENNYINRNFIPGDYSADCARGFDFGILKDRNGNISGFSILSGTQNKYEASSEIARYINCPKNIFEFIIYQNVLWAKEKEYRFFNLGYTYTKEDSEKEKDFARFFAKILAFSEHFNNDFKALKEFKDRFDPVWDEKYAAIHLNERIIMFVKNFTALIAPHKERKRTWRFFKRFFER